MFSRRYRCGMRRLQNFQIQYLAGSLERNMSKPLGEGRYYTRWSEPILRRHYPGCFAPTSEEEASSFRRSRSSSPLLTAHRNSTKRLETRCMCNGHCNGKKSSKNRATCETKRSSETRSKTRRIRESLELQLIGTQVEEALAGDRQSALIQHLDIATNTLEALIQHVQSLQLSNLSAYRVIDFSHQLVIPYPTSSNFCSTLTADLTNGIRQAEILKENRLHRLNSVMEICSKNVTATERLQAIIDEHHLRRDDFSLAAKNFKNLLDNSKLTVSQMEKLHRQYESIMIDYQASRRSLDLELPNIVRTRLVAIRESFRLLYDVYSDLDYAKETASVFRLIGENLCQEEPVADRLSCKENHQSPEICQKCKVNRVDKQ